MAFLGVVLALIVLAATAAIFVLGQPGSPPATGPTVTPQVLVAQPFIARDIEILVPAGSDDAAINRAFAAAFLALARIECNCEPQIQAGTLVYLTGAEPRQAGIGPDGVRYRASLEATLLVPGQ